jgi:hypothetical protein
MRFVPRRKIRKVKQKEESNRRNRPSFPSLSAHLLVLEPVRLTLLLAQLELLRCRTTGRDGSFAAALTVGALSVSVGGLVGEVVCEE